jgi:predicted branched-subunit amino acid permease
MSTLARDHEHSAAVDARWAGRAAAVAGARAIAPLVFGLVPLALTVGTAAAHAGLPPLVGWISSAFLYGGSGQLTWIQMVESGAPAAIVVGTTLMVNVQLLMYGATMRAYWAGESRRWRVVAAHLLVGPVFGVATAHHQTEPDPHLRKVFYMTCGVTLWSAWLVLTGIGYATGGLPSLPVLTVLTPLVMISLALRAVHDVGTTTALIVAVVVAVVAGDMAYDLGLVAAGVAGAVAGVMAERVAFRDDRRRPQVSRP